MKRTWPAGVGRRPAFTLIEMLVVIAVIAVLFAMLMPSLQNARAEGRRQFCMNNMKQLLTAFHMYASDNQGRVFPPRDTNPGWDDPGSHGRYLQGRPPGMSTNNCCGFPDWYWGLPRLGEHVPPKVFKCPDQSYSATCRANAPYCNVAGSNWLPGYSYGLNMLAHGSSYARIDELNVNAIWLFDHGTIGYTHPNMGAWTQTDFYALQMGIPVLGDDIHYWDFPWGTGAPFCLVSKRHTGRFNVMTLGGAGRPIRWGFSTTNDWRGF